jgi:hypothetical protein
MLPVVDLFGTTMTVRVHYIATIGGTTADTIASLHGPVEAAEDLRQICIQQLYPDAFWPYLEDFDARCYPTLQNGTLTDSCWQEVAAVHGIDQARIQTCASGSEGIGLLQNDTRTFGRDWIAGSPTLLVNGTVYSGQRTPEAYKQAICATMTERPDACDVALSTQSGSATGSCG